MKIYQLTDLHLTLHPDDDTFGHDVKLHFDLAVQYIRENPADMLIITGDLCLDIGNLETYQYIRAKVKPLDIPYIVMPGNHDNLALMLECFGHEQCIDSVSLKPLNADFKALYINSGSGVVDNRTLQMVSQHLEDCSTPVLVFIHHPVLSVDVPYMEINHALKNRAALLHLFKKHRAIFYLFCGHYHTDITVMDGNVIQQIAPAVFYQLKPGKALFTPDNLPPAFRELVLQGNTLHSRVVSLSPKNAIKK